MIRRAWWVAALLASVSVASVEGYLKLGTVVGDTVVAMKWPAMPVRYFIEDREVPGVSPSQLQSAVSRAFSTWSYVPTASVSAEFAGFVNTEPFVSDNVSVIGFLSRPDLERTLGATTFTVDVTTGALLEADIFLNGSFDWSVTPDGESQHFDVESIALHEIGHLFGLGHSALGETAIDASGARRVLGKRAVMFPIAFPPGSVSDRGLQADDVAGISDLYGTPEFRASTGSIGGRVTRDGAGVFGAHVTAFNSRTGAMVGSFSLDTDGRFVIGGLDPGVYLLRAEPLDDGDVRSFFEAGAPVDLNFKPVFYSKLVAAPAGGTGPAVEIKVTAK